MAVQGVEQILDFAITNEELAAKFYTGLAGRMKQQHMRDVFLGFAEEEKGHKAKLLEIRSGKRMLASEDRVLDLKIGERLESVAMSDDLSYQDALILAMKTEKAAFRLYNGLASATEDPELRAVLAGLAQEEAKHKLRFEIEYDEEFLKEN